MRALLLAAALAGASDDGPQAVPQVDLARYMGVWYEIAAFPNRMQEGCTDTVVRYSPRPDGGVDLLNTCFKGEKYKPYEGVVRVTDPASNAKLFVRFFLWLGTPYWIIDLDPEYRWAAVGVPDRSRLWIISRTPDLDEGAYRGIVERARAQGFDVSRLRRTAHTGRRPPFLR